MRCFKCILGAAAVGLVAAGVGCSSSSAPSESLVDATSPEGAARVSDDGGLDAPGLEDTSRPDSTVSDGSPDEGAPAGDAEAGLTDGGLTDGGLTDAEVPDAEGGVASPALVAGGSTLGIQGITNDGHVVYYDSSSQSYYAESVRGGSPTLIYAVPATSYYSYARVLVNSVVVLDVGANYVSRETLWSANLPQPVVLTTAGLSTYYSSIWASDDGQHLAYLQVTGDGTVGGIYGANADGSNPTLLVGNIVTSSNAVGRCFPLLTLRAGYAVASYCTNTDAGNPHTVGAFSIANGWAPVLQVPNAIFTRTPFSTPTNPFYFPYVVDPAGAGVIAASSSSAGGALQAFAFDGGSATVLDPSVPMVSPSSLAGGAPTPWGAVYSTDAGALKQAYASNPTPRTLVDAGVTLFDAPSPDGNWMLVSSGESSRGLNDISVVSTVNPGSPLLVATTAQYGNLGMTVNTLPGNAFTADSRYALIFTNLTQDSVGGTIFYARSMGVAPPYAGRLLSNGFAVDMRPLTGSKVLVADNFRDVDGGAGSVPLVDFDVVDPSGDAPGTPLVTSVDADTSYAISADGTFIVYVVASGAAPGVYTVAIP